MLRKCEHGMYIPEGDAVSPYCSGCTVPTAPLASRSAQDEEWFVKDLLSNQYTIDEILEQYPESDHDAIADLIERLREELDAEADDEDGDWD